MIMDIIVFVLGVVLAAVGGGIALSSGTSTGNWTDGIADAFRAGGVLLAIVGVILIVIALFGFFGIIV